MLQGRGFREGHVGRRPAEAVGRLVTACCLCGVAAAAVDSCMFRGRVGAAAVRAVVLHDLFDGSDGEQGLLEKSFQ